VRGTGGSGAEWVRMEWGLELAHSHTMASSTKRSRHSKTGKSGRGTANQVEDKWGMEMGIGNECKKDWNGNQLIHTQCKILRVLKCKLVKHHSDIMAIKIFQVKIHYKYVSSRLV